MGIGIGIGIDDVAHVDLYSCFPVAVIVSALNPAGARILLRASDAETIAVFTDGDPLGAGVDITAANQLTLLTERTVR